MRRGARLAAAWAALILAGCAASEAPAGRGVAATLVPVAAAGELPEPELRYPPGSRLVRLDLDRPDAAPVPLSDGMVAAGAAAVSVDGGTIAFVGRRMESEPFAVWTVDPRLREPRRLEGAPAGAGGIAWLPDGRLVVAAPVAGTPPLDGMTSAWALFVVDPAEGSAQRITFGAGELDPSVLADGRILYSQWQPGGDGRHPNGGFALFTVHPDGTGAAQLHGYHDGARLKLGARQTGTGDLVYAAGETSGDLDLRRADWSRPEAPSDELGLAASAALSAAPAAADGLLVAAREADGDWALQVVGGTGEASWALAAPAGFAFAHAVAIAPRPRPQGHLSMVDPELGEGRLLCIDARPPGLPEAWGVRLWAGTANGDRRALGDVELADDGSFFAVVPADRPLYLDLLAVDGRVLRTTDTPIWVRPREVRACVGCHESAHTAPPNRRPLAVIAEPVDMTAERES